MAREGHSKLAVGAVLAGMVSVLMSVTYGQGTETRRKVDKTCEKVSAMEERQNAFDRYIQDTRLDIKDIKADLRTIAQAVPRG